jgi:hypothetical protein
VTAVTGSAFTRWVSGVKPGKLTPPGPTGNAITPVGGAREKGSTRVAFAFSRPFPCDR